MFWGFLKQKEYVKKGRKTERKGMGKEEEEGKQEESNFLISLQALGINQNVKKKKS